MGIETASPKIKMLLLEVSNKYGKTPGVPADFMALADEIRFSLKQHISPSTLERIWNYSTRNATTISVHTLNLLCEYVGMKNWAAFCVSLNESGLIDSDMVEDKAVFSKSLAQGERLQIGWLPDRKCVIEYSGEYKFKAIYCKNSTLQPGDTFKCIEFIKGQQAVMDELIQASDLTKTPKRYVAGKHHGLSYIKKLGKPDYNIIYFHGLSSSGNSSTGKKLKELFPNENVVTPDIPVNPKEALPFLKNLVSKFDPEKTIIIGTSMGGMYAQQMTGYRRILVNPAFHVSTTLKKNLGNNLPFFSLRKDGATEFPVTESLIEEFEEMEAAQFDNSLDSENVMALFGTRDETVNCKDEYLKYYKEFKDFEGEHRLSEENVENVIAPLIKLKSGLI